MDLLNDPDRPADVTLAIKLVLAVIAIGVVQLVMVVVRHLDVRSPGFPILAQLAMYVFGVFLLTRIARREQWARWVLVAILVVFIPLRLLPTLQSISAYPVFGLLELGQLGLYLGALVLLLKSSTSEWFARSA